MSKKKIKEAICAIYENLGLLVGGGSTIKRSINAIYDETDGKKQKGTIKYMHKITGEMLPVLDEGYQLSDAMNSMPKYFSRAESMQVKAGETSGSLEETLKRLALQTREKMKTSGSIKSALVYPVIIFILTIGVAWYIFTFVMPRMMDMLVDVGVTDLPPFTTMVMNFGNFLGKYSILLIILIVIAVIVIRILDKKVFPVQFGKIKLKIPLMGKIKENNDIAQYYNSFRFCTIAGISISESMKAAEESVTNEYIRYQASKAREEFDNIGCPINEALMEINQISSLEMLNIETGFETGHIYEAFERLEDNRKTESKRATDRFVAAFNPIMICIVGGIVGVIVFAVYTPLLQVTKMF